MLSTSRSLPKWVSTLVRAMPGLLLLGLHIEFMMDASWTEWIYYTLPIIIFPVVLRSYLNLKEFDRWAAYYLIWFQLTTSPSERYASDFGLDAFLFLSMEISYKHYLRTLVGGKVIPMRVYWSSMVSDSKLSAFLASNNALVNNNNDIIKGDDNIEQQSATTTMPTKIKLVYSFITSALVFNTFLIVTTKYWDYICYLKESTFTALTTEEEYDKLNKYCLPAWGSTYMYNFPISGRPETLFALATAYVTATAWSKLPTKIVLRAWIRMWSTTLSNNNYGGRCRSSLFAIKKIHYLLYLRALKWLIAILMMTYSEDSNQEGYFLVWDVVFGHGSNLIFALALLWNLYAVHLGQDRSQHQQQQELLQREGLKCKEMLGASGGDADKISESEKKPFLHSKTHSIHLVDMSPLHEYTMKQ